jgi:hypothetical protein
MDEVNIKCETQAVAPTKQEVYERRSTIFVNTSDLPVENRVLDRDLLADQLGLIFEAAEDISIARN